MFRVSPVGGSACSGVVNNIEDGPVNERFFIVVIVVVVINNTARLAVPISIGVLAERRILVETSRMKGLVFAVSHSPPVRDAFVLDGILQLAAAAQTRPGRGAGDGMLLLVQRGGERFLGRGEGERVIRIPPHLDARIEQSIVL